MEENNRQFMLNSRRKQLKLRVFLVQQLGTTVTRGFETTVLKFSFSFEIPMCRGSFDVRILGKHFSNFFLGFVRLGSSPRHLSSREQARHVSIDFSKTKQLIRADSFKKELTKRCVTNS